MTYKVVNRREDMSPRGYLSLLEQEDGDIIIACYTDNGNGIIEAMAAVEFCVSGGKSPKTLAALRQLMIAMEEDNADRPAGKVVD